MESVLYVSWFLSVTSRGSRDIKARLTSSWRLGHKTSRLNPQSETQSWGSGGDHTLHWCCFVFIMFKTLMRRRVSEIQSSFLTLCAFAWVSRMGGWVLKVVQRYSRQSHPCTYHLHHLCCKNTKFTYTIVSKLSLLSWLSDNRVFALQSSFLLIAIRDGSGYQNWWIFGKLRKGGGVIFNPKIYVADFGNFKYTVLFYHEITYKIVISGFRVCFFNNCIE